MNVPSHSNRAILTLALGPEVYWAMAVNLARSARLWHAPEALPITIVVDRDRRLPADLADVGLRRIRPGELGVGFETKLHLEKIAPAQHTLFIDADCLVYGSLDPVFARFAGQPVGVVTERIASNGERFGDIAAYCRQLAVSEIPVFTGGVYYLEGDRAASVYKTARELVRQYDRLGLIRLRGLPNEEVVIAGAMAQHDLWGIPDDGTITGDFQTSPGSHALDILAGTRTLTNPPPPSPHHCAWSPIRTIHPAIVHFQAYHNHLPPYRADSFALACHAHRVPKSIARPLSVALILAPGNARLAAQDSLRPLFRRVFGTRAVTPTDRTAGPAAPSPS